MQYSQAILFFNTKSCLIIVSSLWCVGGIVSAMWVHPTMFYEVISDSERGHS